MKHKSFLETQCPIARGLERVGEWWSMLIIREAFYGAKRFDEFQQGLGEIAPNTLTRRLKELVENGIFERRLYSTRPERYEYILTERGRDFLPVLWTMLEWGNKHFCPEGDLVHLKNVKTGKKAKPFLADQVTGQEMLAAEYQFVAKFR
ncbi:transcriptional regulator [Hylemonella gracilis]|uniref:Transcriptional regulator n=1 Tax=Hylemonella gracilis TaxID=80880 RepID=A0A4P6UHV6_9BURK|nr:helix-turn-helix domain-containing protein [Hylemonella gracilis]QBK04642.1 transcriptional regulator [Hylemonella gracilis]